MPHTPDEVEQLGFFHDEIQAQEEPQYAKCLGQDIKRSIQQAGEYYSLGIGLDGDYQIGPTWADTH